MRRIIFLFLAGVVLATCVRGAQAESPQVLSDILRKLESHYQEMPAFTAVFHQWTTSSAASGMTTEATGKLFYQKPRQMRWEYELPERQIFVANQRLAWLYVPQEKQISLFEASRFFSSPLAQTFFDGIIELKNHFEVSLDSKLSSATSAVLKLSPKQEDPNIKQLTLNIELLSYRITGIESHDHLGNSNRIVLEHQQAAPRLDQKLFQLEAPPSTIVLDTEGRELSPSEVEKLK